MLVSLEREWASCQVGDTELSCNRGHDTKRGPNFCVGALDMRMLGAHLNVAQLCSRSRLEYVNIEPSSSITWRLFGQIVISLTDQRNGSDSQNFYI